MCLVGVRRLVRDKRVLGLAVGTIGLSLVFASPAASQATVQRVDVSVTIEDDTPPLVIVEQLHSTAQTVADRLFLGRAIDTLQSVQPPLEKVLGDVIGRVATGYAVSSVTIAIGVNSTVTVRLKSQGKVIRAAEVSVDLQAIHPKLRSLFAALMQRGIIEEVRALYVGVPVLAWDWAGPILELRVRSAVASVLRGYTASVRVTPDTTAHIDLGIAIEDSRTIRNLSVRFRSASIPILLLDQHAPEVASMAEPLLGIPVAFAQAHQRDLEQLLEAELAAFPPVQEYGIVASVGLDVAETTYMTVVADSLTWRGRVEAQLNIGSRAPGPAILIHLGRVVVPPTEAFVEVRLIPNTLGVEWDFGAQLAVAPTTFVGLSYAVAARTMTAFTRFQVSRDVGLRGALNLTDQSFEGGINYRANDFLSGELIATSRGEVWLRLISNL
jgi:hypothetical protein